MATGRLLLPASDAQVTTIAILYTETNGEAYETARAAFATASSTLYVRVDPLGATTGNFRHTTGKGVITAFPQFAENLVSRHPAGLRPGLPRTTRVGVDIYF